MILIFVEDTYSHSGWCQDLVDGLVSDLKMKRMAFRFIHSIEEMNQSSGYIYVIGSSTGWIRTVLKDANRVGIYPILLVAIRRFTSWTCATARSAPIPTVPCTIWWTP